MGRGERLTPGGFTFRAGEFKVLLAFEALLTLAWELTPEVVLINYIVFALKKTVFEVALVAVVSSLASIIGTYASEHFPKGRGFQGMSLGMLTSALYAALMMISPPFWLVIIAYSLDAFGGTFWFPFYRSWMFKLIPKERASEFHAAISSYKKVIGIVTPFMAGALASVHATLPYAFSLAFFLLAGVMFWWLARKGIYSRTPS